MAKKVVKGYEFEPEFGGGKYLSLKTDGDQVTVRIASTPKHGVQHWIEVDGKRSPMACSNDVDCLFCGDKIPKEKKVDKSPVFAWVVIDRKDGKVKIFNASSVTIYRRIKALALDEEWGDPQTYDIRIERTGKKGPDFYRVVPLPRTLDKPITDEEKAAIKEADYNLDEEIEGGSDTSTFGSGDKETFPEELAGETPEKKGKTGGETNPPTVEETDEDDEIPF